MNRRRTYSALGIGLCITIGVAVASSQGPAASALPPSSSNDGALVTVAATRVTRTDLARSAEYTAELRPYLDVDLHAKVAGFLKTISVDIGDRVTAGQVIARLELPEQEADLAKAKADYAVLKLNYERVTAVAAKEPGLLAQQDIDKAQGDYEEARAAFDRAKILTDYAVITAPFNGVITKRYADPGALIQAGTASTSQSMPLVHLSELDRLRLDFPVPQSLAPFVTIGMPVSVEIPATEEVIQAKVARDTDDVDPSTRMMTVELDIDNHDLHLKPGMYAMATISLQTADNALVLPVQAVEFGTNPSVWTIGPTGTLEQRPIEIGLQTPDLIEITHGLRLGDAVVFGTPDGLRQGMHIAPKFID